MMKRENELSNTIIGLAIELLRHLGPGLFESVYEECLCQEFSIHKMAFERQEFLPINYKDVKLD